MLRRTTNTVLITGFEPFAGATTNPSALVASALDGQMIAKRRVIASVLPVVFGASLRALYGELRRVRPELVICIGQAGGREAIGVERVAINVDDASVPDNEGAQPIDQPIARRGPAAYWSTLPIKAIVAALRAENLPAEVSQTAGTFVCNHLFYGLMHRLRRWPDVRGGFIHVPYLPEQVSRLKLSAPSLPLERTTRGLEIAIETTLMTKRDVLVTGGATH